MRPLPAGSALGAAEVGGCVPLPPQKRMLVPHLSSALRQAQTDPSQNTTCLSVCLLICFNCVCLFVTPWTVAHQAPLSMRMSRQEYWSGLPCPPPGDLPDPGIEPVSPAAPTMQVDSLPLSHRKSPTCPRPLLGSSSEWSH